jgi:hypothetical protein
MSDNGQPDGLRDAPKALAEGRALHRICGEH